MEVMCVDGSFDGETLARYKQYGVITPKENSLYNIRAAISYTIGKVGVYLEEIKNPNIPYIHPILGPSQMEPSFNIERFRHLDGTPIMVEEVEELKILKTN